MIAAAPGIFRTIHRPSVFIADVAYPEEIGRGGRKCLLGRFAIFRVYRSKSCNIACVRLLIAKCQVDYSGRLTAHLPMENRLILLKADGSVAIHADDRAYKPLNWMSPPCRVEIREPGSEDHPEAISIWDVIAQNGDLLKITISEVVHDFEANLGVDPGLQKDGVEAHLQVLLSENPTVFGADWRLVQREYATPIGPVDLLLRNDSGAYVAVEVKRRGEIDGVNQLLRYLEYLNADPMLAPVTGVFAAQQIKPQAKTWATDHGIRCVTVDYDELRGMDSAEDRLF